jgi:SAM-dependent methyltransferase
VANTLALDLYAKVEDLLGVKEVAPSLYAHYLLALQSFAPSSLLDIGCGSGDFLLQMRDGAKISHVEGIDQSPRMVAQTKSKGLIASTANLSDLQESYDAITAVFDMLNYLDPQTLPPFLASIASRLNQGGIFLCDINTAYGFEEVAVGSFIVDDGNRFITIDSDYAEGIYASEFTLFEKQKHGFEKSQEMIYQYLHQLEDIHASLGLRLVSVEEISLYQLEKPDKLFLIFQKC